VPYQVETTHIVNVYVISAVKSVVHTQDPDHNQRNFHFNLLS